MAGRRGSFSAPQRKRRMSWEAGAFNFADLTSGTAQFSTLVSEAILENFPTPTLVRTRGAYLTIADTTCTAGAFGLIACGIIKVTAAAIAASGIPDPITDPGNDWLWWNVSSIGEETTSALVGRTVAVDRKDIDSKAMRKIGNNEALVVVAAIEACAGTVVANVCGRMRLLFKAP